MPLRPVRPGGIGRRVELDARYTLDLPFETAFIIAAECLAVLVAPSAAPAPFIAERRRRRAIPRGDFVIIEQARRRSDDHTSEIQTLMRLSFDVFCLKKLH